MLVMSQHVSRRKALKTIGAAGVGAVLAPAVVRGQSSTIVVNGKPVEIAIASISASTVRISVLPIAASAVNVRNDGALVPAADGKALGRRRANFTPITAGNLVVLFGTDSRTLHVDTVKGAPVQQLTLDPKSPIVTFALGKGPLLGLGEGGPQFDRKGSTFTTRNGQGGYQLRTHGGRVPIQWLVGTDGWGMFIHRPIGSFDLTGPMGSLTPADDSQALDVFITASNDPAVIMREYARITGFAELPPRWAFGYMQSHRTLSGPEEIMSVARTFRQKKLPCDALIYLGTEFTPSGWNTRNGEFGWKPENFPNPKQMIDTLHDQNFKVVLHVVIEGKHMTGAVAGACTPDKAVPSGRTADDKWPDERPVECYWPYHKPLYDLGIDGMWPDQGDGLDEPSRMTRIRMYWEGPQVYRPNQRPFALHRNGSPGMQRYGAFLWSGDVYSFWETLKTHVPVAINTGLSGIPFWGTDIGGFVPTADYTGELHVRWFQFGTFCPSFRAHGRNWKLRLPWGWNTGEFGVSELRGYTNGAADPDPSELHNAAVEPIVKKYLELRYRLMPYTYSIAKECAETGMPMMRALWLHHADDPQAVARGDQFLWGRDILVSPVVEKGATTRRLYLPKGKWFDFWTEQAVEGGREIDRPVDLETMPLHVRAGAIIPHDPVRQHVDEEVSDPLQLTIYPGSNGSFELYDDDGRTFEYRRGEFTRLAIRWNDATRQVAISLAPGSRMLVAGVLIEARVAGETRRRGVLFEGKPVELQL
jgi:alpha-glucosidase (family GH31 glycosyl hydrolase)